MEKQKNLWFTDQDFQKAQKDNEIEKQKFEEKKRKEIENRKFVAEQIGILNVFISPSVEERR